MLKLLLTLTTRRTSPMTGALPVFEGFPAEVDTKRHVLWTVLGLYDAGATNFVRTLVGLSMDTGKIVFNNWLGAIYQLTDRDRRKPFMPGVDPEDPLASIF